MFFRVPTRPVVGCNADTSRRRRLAPGKCTIHSTKLLSSILLVSLCLIERARGWTVPSARHPVMVRSPRWAAIAAAASTAMGDGESSKLSISNDVVVSAKVWGILDGREVHRIDIDTPEGFGVSFSTYGATLLSVRAGDNKEQIEEVTLQYDTLEDVAAGTAYYGSTVGRVCNRIAGAKFSVDGRSFTLAANDGPNCLHSGPKAFDKALWRHQIVREDDGAAGVRFELDSPDGDEGFPGNLAVKATYTVRRGGGKPGTGELHSRMEATHIKTDTNGASSSPTPINLTNHAYWNLSGGGKRLVRGHDLFLRCDRYLPLDDQQIPTGELAPVPGTFFDFSEARPLGAAIDGIGGEPPGLDHCLVTIGATDDGKAKAKGNTGEQLELPLIARLHEPQSGRVMEVSGSQPGVQVYTANYLSEDPGDKPHVRHNAVCLETQHFPNAVNNPAWAQSVLVPPGATYSERSKHVFSVVEDGKK
ncbi:unnamed protein product [Ascophyllum nodosum]